MVILTDKTLDHERADTSFHRAAAWAREHCPSFKQHDVVWVGDVSYEHDFMCEYEFEDDKDAFFFKLRWE